MPRSGARAPPSPRATAASHRRRRAARSRRSRSRQRGAPLDEELEEALRVDVDADVRVPRRVGQDVPAFDEDAPVAELRCGLDLTFARERGEERRADQMRARYGNVDRRAVEVVALPVE